MESELRDQNVSEQAWDSPVAGTWLSWVPFIWLFGFASKKSLAASLVLRARGEFSAGPRYYALLLCVAVMCLVALPWPTQTCVSEFQPHFVTKEYNLFVPWGQADTPLVTVNSLGVDLSHIVCAWGLDYSGLLPLRIGATLLTIMALPKLAYATPVEVREEYIADRFSKIYYDGPLPSRFGLPGYVSNRPLKPLGEGCEIHLKDPEVWVETDEPKDMLFAVGVVFGGYLPSVALPCQHNLMVGARNRQLAATPAPDLEEFDGKVTKYLEIFGPSNDIDDLDFDEWNGRFPSGRQGNHIRALEKVRDQANTWFLTILRNCFMKVEKIMRIAKGEYDPRVITGASDEFNVQWGNYFYKARDVIKAAYNELPGNVLLASGSTSRDLGKWFEAAMETSGRAICGDDQLIIVDGVFIEADGERHDSHMNKGFFTAKWRIYKRLLRVIPRTIQRLAMDAAKTTVAISRRFGITYQHSYRVRSGDPDTECGNSILTDLVAKEIQDMVRKLIADGVPVSEMEDIVAAHILRIYGYKVTLKITRDATAVTFLSGAFAPVDGDMYWYPLPGRQLSKIGWSMRDVPEDVRWKDYAGVLNSFRDFSFVPFIRKYVDVVSQMIPEEYRLEKPSRRWLVGPGITPQDPSDDTWDWFSLRYSFDSTDEEEFTIALQGATSLPYMVTSSHIERMARVDMA